MYHQAHSVIDRLPACLLFCVQHLLGLSASVDNPGLLSRAFLTGIACKLGCCGCAVAEVAFWCRQGAYKVASVLLCCSFVAGVHSSLTAQLSGQEAKTAAAVCLCDAVSWHVLHCADKGTSFDKQGCGGVEHPAEIRRKGMAGDVL